MKYLLLLASLILAFVLGYVTEPLLRDTLIASAQNAEPEPPVVEEILEAEEPGPAPAPAPGPAEPEMGPEPEVVRVPEVLPVAQEVDLPAPTDSEIRQIMSDSIERREIQHFTLTQVTEWKEVGEEEINGDTYHFGLIDYVEKTSLGERVIEAKALIRDRKVEKWIWTRSGIRIE